MEATPKTPLPTTRPGEETAVISADILDNLQVNNRALFEPITERYFADKVALRVANWLISYTDGRKSLLTQKLLIVLRAEIVNFPHSPQRT